MLLSAIQKFINSIRNKKVLPDQWKDSIIVPIHKKGNKTDCINYRGISMLSYTYNILTSILLSRLSLYKDKIIGIINMGSDVIDQTFYIRQILEKKWECIDKKAYDSARRKVLYNIPTKWCNVKQVRLIKMCLNEACSKIRAGKHLYDGFPIQNDQEQGFTLSPFSSSLL
jgi:hypothetical protein